VGHKKRDTFIFSITQTNIDRFSYFFTTIYNNKLQNKNLLKFSPHLKSVAALPCETWNFKCVDIQQGHIQFKTDWKCQVTVLTFSSRRAQNDPLLLVHRRWVAHATDLSLSFVQCCATHSTGADRARRRHLRVSRRPAFALQPRSYNPRGSYLGCLGALVGRNKSGVSRHKSAIVSCAPVGRCTVLLEYEIVIGYFLDAWHVYIKISQ